MSAKIETCVLCGNCIEINDIRGHVMNTCTCCPNIYHAHHQCFKKTDQRTFVDKSMNLESSYMKNGQKNRDFVAAINKKICGSDHGYLVTKKMCLDTHIREKGQLAINAINERSMYIEEIKYKAQQVQATASVPKAIPERKAEKVSLVAAFLNNESKKTNYRFFETMRKSHSLFLQLAKEFATNGMPPCSQKANTSLQDGGLVLCLQALSGHIPSSSSWWHEVILAFHVWSHCFFPQKEAATTIMNALDEPKWSSTFSKQYANLMGECEMMDCDFASLGPIAKSRFLLITALREAPLLLEALYQSVAKGMEDKDKLNEKQLKDKDFATFTRHMKDHILDYANFLNVSPAYLLNAVDKLYSARLLVSLKYAPDSPIGKYLTNESQCIAVLLHYVLEPLEMLADNLDEPARAQTSNTIKELNQIKQFAGKSDAEVTFKPHATPTDKEYPLKAFVVLQPRYSQKVAGKKKEVKMTQEMKIKEENMNLVKMQIINEEKLEEYRIKLENMKEVMKMKETIKEMKEAGMKMKI